MSRTRQWITTALALVTGVGSTWVATQGAGALPPVGKLLDPSVGVWTAVTNADLPVDARATIPGLEGAVEIRYDQRSVPHIFAQHPRDALRALGYVVARDRLFQIELQTRAGEGTLTELVGPLALPLDRATRRLGMPRAAEQRLARLDTTSETYQALVAYAAGVNAYRTSLSVAERPVEYKLLNRAPREYLPIHALHLFNRMGYTLAHDPLELQYLQAKALVGDSAARGLFDIASPVQEPIQPTGATAPRELPFRQAPPSAPDTLAGRLVAALSPRRTSVGSSLDWRDGTPAEERELRAMASNNWAVSPAKSSTGKALLAGDPHLELTLPSIWFEVHMVVPGHLDVGGVTIPGLPGVTIGYTPRFAWSFTNTGADVMDFWRETVDNDASPTAYRLDGAMVPFVATRVETYRSASGVVLAVDTVRYTHRGPLSREGAQWLSMRWTVLEAMGELTAFLQAIRAETAPAFLDSMARYYQAPAQNMIVADTTGTIAIRSTGRFPIRADSGRGIEILDGSTRKTDWIGDWPVTWYPQAQNPAQGYLASANQEPIDPEVRRPYLGVDRHYEIWRALQINRLMRQTPMVSPDSMRAWHTNPGSVRADRVVPQFIAAARARTAAGDTAASLGKALALLEAWDRRYTSDNTGARLFETAFALSRRLTLEELVPAGKTDRVTTPSEAWQLALMTDSANAWWDDRTTNGVRETRDMILARALRQAYDTLVVQHGDPAKTPWRWGQLAPARLHHLLKLPGFSIDTLAINGGRGTLNPSAASSYGANFGASWRMVVELSSPMRLRAIYPGGQSGNPGSPRYTDRVAMWATGQLDSVRTPRTAADLAPADIRATLRLEPAASGGR
ncbi:MAG: penicillin acylase family protein [Gemmatimonadaceae bacterium]|jgi:penicillin amidase|nr:penicillin acylase family protein [Gemmatimonadaceae bacterium]